MSSFSSCCGRTFPALANTSWPEWKLKLSLIWDPLFCQEHRSRLNTLDLQAEGGSCMLWLPFFGTRSSML